MVPTWKKKGSKKDCSTYRGISLLSHMAKMYANILEQRTRYKVEHLLSEAQVGFRKGRGCTDTIFALRQLSEKIIEYNKELNLVFVDQEKAFDRVNRNKLWETLEEYNVRGQLLDNIRAIYTNSMSAVRTQDGLTEWFGVTSGVRQGCVLPPLLFNVYMDKITREANPNPEDLNEMLFADDQSLIHEKEGELQEHTNSLNTQCENFDMKISISKTETMKVSRTPGRLNINGTTLKQVGEFKYLGSIFTSQQRDRDENSKGHQRQLPACPTPKTPHHPHRDQSQTYRVHNYLDQP